jgi:hypothetical protein
MSDEALEKELADVHEILQHGWEDEGTEHPEGVESVIQKYGLDRALELIVAFVQAESWSLYDRTSWLTEQYNLETVEQLRQFDVDWEPIVLQWVSETDDPIFFYFWNRLTPEIDSAAVFKALFRSDILDLPDEGLESFPHPSGHDDDDEVADLLAQYLNSPDAILAERACRYIDASFARFDACPDGFVEYCICNAKLVPAIFAAIERRALGVWEGLWFLQGGLFNPGPHSGLYESYFPLLKALRAHPVVSEDSMTEDLLEFIDERLEKGQHLVDS